MKKFQNILCPVDFSDAAQNAFIYALQFAETTGASITALHVIYPQYEALDLPVMVAEATREKVKAAREVLESFLSNSERIARERYDLKNMPEITREVEIGATVRLICEMARKKESSLIILGTNGEHSRIEKWMGSVAAGVVEHAGCHVLVIPEEIASPSITTIAIASDLNRTDAYNIWNTGQLLENFNPIIRCVHIEPTSKEETDVKMNEMVDFFAENAPGLQITFQSLSNQSVDEGINEFVEVWEAELLVMFDQHRSLISKIFHPSQTRRMAMHTHVPLLVIK